MQTKLRQYFPMLRTREEILKEIDANVKLTERFYSWKEEQRQEFLDFCTGVRGVKMLYDSFFKEIMNPETVPERLEEFLSILLHKRVKILEILPGDSTRLADEQSLLIMDLLQKYIFIPLDIFRKNIQNRGIKNKLDAWLTFLGMDNPEKIVELINTYPEFRQLYEHVYYICQNVEAVMGIFSEELLILDRNTVSYMVDQMQEEIDAQKITINEQEKEIEELKAKLKKYEKQK